MAGARLAILWTLSDPRRANPRAATVYELLWLKQEAVIPRASLDFLGAALVAVPELPKVPSPASARCVRNKGGSRPDNGSSLFFVGAPQVTVPPTPFSHRHFQQTPICSLIPFPVTSAPCSHHSSAAEATPVFPPTVTPLARVFYLRQRGKLRVFLFFFSSLSFHLS